MTSPLQPPEQIRAELLAAAGRGATRRRRLAVGVAVAIAVLAATATVAAGTVAGWFSGEATFHSSTQPAVVGSFPTRLACTVAAAGSLACTEGSPAAGAYPFDFITRVHGNSAGAVGGGVVSPDGTAEHPPLGVPGWISCIADGAAYRCDPVASDTELPPGTPVYQLDFSAWTTG
jgi:hypothetical protein